MRVLRWGGIEAESELAFAALHELLRPVVRSWRSHRRPRLPVRPVPRASLEGRFLIGVAVLSLLAEAAYEARAGTWATSRRPFRTWHCWTLPPAP
jgi:hypothetical protein